MQDENRDINDYLARIRKTIADSENLISKAQLRMAETDRMLEAQGLTREQVLDFRFTEAQRLAANEEMKRRGFEPLEDEWSKVEGLKSEGLRSEDLTDLRPSDFRPWTSASDVAPDAELAERQRKFGLMMKPFQI